MSRPSGIIKLIHRAPLDMTYQHQIDFKSPSDQQTYWGSKTKYQLSDYTYIRREKRSVHVNKTFDELEGINYLAYQARSETGTKWYYCFVTDKEYVNDTSTRLFFEIDVFQTFMFDYAFKPSYISQAHVDRWDANHMPIYSRTDEGLNYGTEYVTESAYKMWTKGGEGASGVPHGFYLIYLSGFNEAPESGEVIDFGAIVAHTTKVAGNPIPFTLLMIPNLWVSTQANLVCGYDDGTTVTSVSNMDEFQMFMANSAIGQYIKQIVYLPYSPFPYTVRLPESSEVEGAGVDLIFHFESWTTARNVRITSGQRVFDAIWLEAITKCTDTFASMSIFEGLEEKIPSDAMWADLKANPRKTERDRRYESKLLCFPYRYNIFTDWQSTPCLVKNEYIGGDTITVKGSIGLGFNTPRRWWIDNYRKDPEGREVSISQSLPFEQAIISDAYYSYMLQNKNQISANITNAKVNAVTGTLMAGVGGATTGGVSGAVTGMLTSGIESAVNIGNMLRSENAKQADIKNLPDTISPSNDVTLAIADQSTFITFYRKSICCEFEEQLAQYWHMFGYKVNKMEIPDLRSRVRYNFIKTIGANLEGAVESNYMATLKAIYDNGVTIWHYSTEDFHPLDYTYENPEVKLT